MIVGLVLVAFAGLIIPAAFAWRGGLFAPNRVRAPRVRPTGFDIEEPITGREQDALGRAPYAELVADELCDALPGESTVYAITGPWGAGKTSFLNMVDDALNEEPKRIVLRFNPWLFAGAEQLLTRFFVELAAQIRVKLPGDRRTAQELAAYGDAIAPAVWVPVAGPWIARIGQLASASRALTASKGSIEQRRDALAQALDARDQPIFVFIDDVDRLEPHEVREVLRLVRLVANLPNVVHVLAFDEIQVEAALRAQDIQDPHAFLEKIVQRSFALPNPDPQSVGGALIAALDAKVGAISGGSLQIDRYQDILAEIVLPLVATLRDAKRYVGAVASTVRALGSAVELSDLLALEAIRIFLPQSFAILALSPNVFAGVQSQWREAHAEADGTLTAFLSSEECEVLRATLRRVFPGSSHAVGGPAYGPDWLATWLRERRVAHPDILLMYLHRRKSTAVIASEITDTIIQAFERADAAVATTALTTSGDKLGGDAEVIRLVQTIAEYPGELTRVAVHTGVAVLVDLYGQLTEDPAASLFALGADLHISRAVLRLLRAEEDETERVAVVRDAFNSSHLFAKYELVSLVGYRDNVGHRLVPEQDAAALEEDLRAEILASSPADLALERPLTLLYWVLTRAAAPGDDDARVSILAESLGEALLADAITHVRRQQVGSRVVEVEDRLAWDVLVRVMGSEDAIRRVVDRLDSTDLASATATVVRLARRYLDGWRPDRI